MTYLIYRFCIKKRRQDFEQNWEEEDASAEKGVNEFTLRRDARSSTHTVGSIASTVLTRASNIIQIAYIPGVTNRDGPNTHSMLIPPVPPIPAALGSQQPGSTYSQDGQEQHFFMPGDLRDSTYSGHSGLSDMDSRSTYTRQSIAPSLARSSVASTVYRNDAVVDPMPAQTNTIVRGKAAMVSVKSSQGSSPIDTPGATTPPVPAVDYQRHGQKAATALTSTASDAGRSSSSSSNRSNATIGKPTPITFTRGKAIANGTAAKQSDALRRTALQARPATAFSVANSPDTATSQSRAIRYTDDSDDESLDNDDDPHHRARNNLIGTAHTRDSAVTEIQDTPATMQFPFADDSPYVPRVTPGGLSAVIEEATKRASREPTHDGLGGKRGISPFSDVHATQ
ncbi:hypothetical protein LTR04_000319 [Oleoguttula sp. CCFEE 6159]|nr:hypothetical protein LTR04_000319 [Oleoguttula sp. CCFEE 6159]